MKGHWIPFEPHGGSGWLVVLEGDPGAGKTSAASAGDIQISGAITVPQLNHLNSTDSTRAFDVAHPEDWYLDMERERQASIRQMLLDGHVVIQDRGILSTLAYAYASAKRNNEHARLRRFLRRLREGDAFLIPDTLVILRVDVEVGVARRPRFMQSQLYREWFDRPFLYTYQQFYLRTAPGLVPCPAFVIDTTLLSRDRAVGLVLSRASGTVTNSAGNASA